MRKMKTQLGQKKMRLRRGKRMQQSLETQTESPHHDTILVQSYSRSPQESEPPRSPGVEVQHQQQNNCGATEVKSHRGEREQQNPSLCPSAPLQLSGRFYLPRYVAHRAPRILRPFRNKIRPCPGTGNEEEQGIDQDLLRALRAVSLGWKLIPVPGQGAKRPGEVSQISTTHLQKYVLEVTSLAKLGEGMRRKQETLDSFYQIKLQTLQQVRVYIQNMQTFECVL